MRKQLDRGQRKITLAMIQWAKEQGACKSMVDFLKPGMTFSEAFFKGAPYVAGGRSAIQFWTLIQLGEGFAANSPWFQAPPDSEAEFQAFLDIVDQWEIV